VAALGNALISGTYGALLPIFYQDYLGLRPIGSGWLRPSTRSGTRINDPLFGYITDSTRSRWGRRIPYMRFTAPFLALTFILVWFAPQGGRPDGCSGGCWWTMLLYDTCYTIIGLAIPRCCQR
jgi:glycoside/pentoside/hexuronide:cation symporter, GPH family